MFPSNNNPSFSTYPPTTPQIIPDKNTHNQAQKK